ncbi:MAG: hypothetical protein IAG10_01060 [Planctomycetaceae bacterium]|nr:hypothetical protein [Planctomycetaceae bacterium]
MIAANRIARQFNHGIIDVDHLLWGIIQDEENVASQLLIRLNVNLDELRQRIESFWEPIPEAQVFVGKLPQTPYMKGIINSAMDEARLTHDNYIGTEHLLRGLLCDQGCRATQTLMSFGLDLDIVREEARRYSVEIQSHPPSGSQSESSER